MCFVQSQDPPPIQQPASIADPQVQQARSTSNARNRAAAGSQSTILSSLFNIPMGGQKQLLGQ